MSPAIAGAPRLIQKFMHDLWKVAIACGVNRGWFNQRLAPQSPILIKQSSALVPEHFVANRKRAIKIAQVERGGVERLRWDCSCEGLAKQVGDKSCNICGYIGVSERRCCRVKGRWKPGTEHECPFQEPRWPAGARNLERLGMLIVA